MRPIRPAIALERLRKRDIELAILRPALFDPEDDLRVDRLFDERACVVAARTHSRAARCHLQWPELLQQRWVLPPADCCFYEHVRCSLDGMHMRLPFELPATSTVVAAVSLKTH